MHIVLYQYYTYNIIVVKNFKKYNKNHEIATSLISRFLMDNNN